MLPPILILLVSTCTSQLVFGSSIQGQDKQALLTPYPSQNAPDANARAGHIVDKKILEALKTHPDPVTALLSLQPEIAAELAQKRLLHVFGEEKPQWMTEGDKLRLRRLGKKFADITDHQDFYATQQVDVLSGKASAIFPNPRVKRIMFTL